MVTRTRTMNGRANQAISNRGDLWVSLGILGTQVWLFAQVPQDNALEGWLHARRGVACASLDVARARLWNGKVRCHLIPPNYGFYSH